MGKFENTEKKGGFPLWILVVIALCAVAVVLFLLLGGDHTPDETEANVGTTEGTLQTEPSESASETEETETEETAPKAVLQVLSTEEQGEYVTVTTTYGSFRYPFAFSDLIQIQAMEENGSESLMFYAVIGDTGAKLFTIRFDDGGAVALGAMTVDQDGTTLPLTADVYSAPDTLDADGKNTYYAAQEIFNDVVISLQENENFVSEN